MIRIELEDALYSKGFVFVNRLVYNLNFCTFNLAASPIPSPLGAINQPATFQSIIGQVLLTGALSVFLPIIFSFKV